MKCRWKRIYNAALYQLLKWNAIFHRNKRHLSRYACYWILMHWFNSKAESILYLTKHTACLVGIVAGSRVVVVGQHCRDRGPFLDICLVAGRLRSRHQCPLAQEARPCRNIGDVEEVYFQGMFWLWSWHIHRNQLLAFCLQAFPRRCSLHMIPLGDGVGSERIP